MDEEEALGEICEPTTTHAVAKAMLALPDLPFANSGHGWEDGGIWEIYVSQPYIEDGEPVAQVGIHEM